jgi:steroid delta-isomerase-like uncharacterized protein
MGRAGSRQVVESFLADVLSGGAPGRSAELVGDQMFALRTERFRTAFPELHVTLRQLVAQDDLVAVHLIGSGTHRGLFQGCPPTGRSWEATCTAIYQVDDGRIARAWVNWDLLAIMEQIGAVERVATVSA